MSVPETFFSVNEQLILFGLSCLFGGLIGVFYDVFRTARLILPHNSTLVALEDIIFLCGYAVFLTAFVSAAARGEFRFYYVIGNAIGFTLYLSTVGSAVILTIRKLLSLVKAILSFIICPFKKLYVFLCKKYTLKFVGSSKVFVKSIKNAEKLLLKRGNLLYNNKESINRKDVDCVGKKSKKKEKGSLQQRSR